MGRILWSISRVSSARQESFKKPLRKKKGDVFSSVYLMVADQNFYKTIKKALDSAQTFKQESVLQSCLCPFKAIAKSFPKLTKMRLQFNGLLN